MLATIRIAENLSTYIKSKDLLYLFTITLSCPLAVLKTVELNGQWQKLWFPQTTAEYDNLEKFTDGKLMTLNYYSLQCDQ